MCQFISINSSSLRLLIIQRSSWLRIEPHNYKSKESPNNRPQSSNPHPTAADPPAARILVVCKVADGHFVLFLDVGQERPLVVDAEREDAMLVGNRETGAIYGAVLCPAGRTKSQTVERGEHGELELKRILGRDFKRDEPVVAVFG